MNLIIPPSCLIAVIDVETTGLDPGRGDRVVEVAVVVVDCGGRIVREFCSLVNPGRDMGPIGVHGVDSELARRAPKFGELAGGMLEAMTGVVAVCGHHVGFDLGFLESEFSRIGVVLPRMPILDTLELCGGGSLGSCCRRYGIMGEGTAHHAMADARMTARLLWEVLKGRGDLVGTIGRLKAIEWPGVDGPQKPPISRREALEGMMEKPEFIRRVEERLEERGGGIEGAGAAYLEILEGALEDRVIDERDADALLDMAGMWGLGREEVLAAHESFMRRLVEESTGTEADFRDLKLAARQLGLVEDLDGMMQDGMGKRRAEKENWAGKKVCFVGEFQCRISKKRITREMAARIAASEGMRVVEKVTQGVDLVVTADPYTQNAKVRKAREYGVRVVYERVFWRKAGVEVE